MSLGPKLLFRLKTGMEKLDYPDSALRNRFVPRNGVY